jgi:hypothetical protein
MSIVKIICDSTSPTNKKKVSYNNKIQNNKIQNNNDAGIERVYIVSCGTTGKETIFFDTLAL